MPNAAAIFQPYRGACSGLIYRMHGSMPTTPDKQNQQS